MSGRPRFAHGRGVAALAALTLGVAGAAWPCGDCPEHRGGHDHRADAIATHVHGGHAEAHAGGATGNGSHAGSHGQDQAAPSPASRLDAAGSTVGSSGSPDFAVGDRYRPAFLARQASGLGAGARPGGTSHPSPAERVVAEALAARRGPAQEPVATRAALSTAQATRRLSKRCQKLLKAKRPSKLRRADRKRRSACLRQRRELIRKSRESHEAEPPPQPAPGAPAPVLEGPKPTTAPPPATQQPAPPAPTTPQQPGEVTNEMRCTDGNPATTCFAAAGVMAIDGDVPFVLTRGDVRADVVNFELQNTDRQVHDLWIAPADAEGNITGPPTKIVGEVEPDGRSSRDMALQPGVYRLICTIPGHGPMSVRFIVRAPSP